jgi:hypothetical protein
MCFCEQQDRIRLYEPGYRTRFYKENFGFDPDSDEGRPLLDAYVVFDTLCSCHHLTPSLRLVLLCVLPHSVPDTS